MAQPFVISFKIAGDARGGVQAANDQRQALVGLSNEAQSTRSQVMQLQTSLEGRTARLVNLGAGIKDGIDTKARAADIEAYGRQLDDLRAKYNPVFAAQRQYDQNLSEIRRANEIGAISNVEMVAALKREEEAFRSSGSAIALNTKALERNAAAAKVGGGNGFNVANLSAQFQDVAVTSAMGMSPTQIALQQGTQAASAFAGMGIKEAAATTAGAVASLVSPVSLLTIGLVGLGAAGIQAFMGLLESQNTAAKSLDDYRADLQRILTGWDDAGAAAKRALDVTEKKPKGLVQAELQASINEQSKAADALDQRIKNAQNRLAEVAARIRENQISAATAGEDSSAVNAPLKQIEFLRDLKLSAQTAKPELDAIRVAAQNLINTTDDPSVKGFAADFLTLANDLSAAGGAATATGTSLAAVNISAAQIASIRNLSAALRGLAGIGMPNISALDEVGNAYHRAIANAHGRDEVDDAQRLRDEAYARLRLSDPGFNMPAMDPAVSRGAAVKVYNETRTAAENYASEVSKLDMLLRNSSIDEETYARAVKKARTEMDQANKREANASGATAANAAAAKAAKPGNAFDQRIEQLRLEMTLIGKSAEQVEKERAAFALLNQEKLAGVAITAEVIAGINRQASEYAALQVQLQRQQAAYQAIDQVASNSIDSIVSSFADGGDSIGDVLAKIAKDWADLLLQMAVTNPIRNALLGQNNPTLGDAGGWIGQLLGGFFGGGNSFIGGTAGAPALQLGYQVGVPHFASGTFSAPGGLSRIHERGGEIVDLPSGARVYPHDISRMMAAGASGSSSSSHEKPSLTVINMSNAQVREGREDDRQGGRKPDYVIEEAVASSLARPRGAAQKALGAAGRVTRR